jgi:hypothetical protein
MTGLEAAPNMLPALRWAQILKKFGTAFMVRSPSMQLKRASLDAGSIGSASCRPFSFARLWSRGELT